MPPELAVRLDAMVRERGFPNRSQAVAEILERRLGEDATEDGATVMAGTITLFLEASRPGLLQRLKRIQREHIAEVISVQDVFLEGDYLLEVLLVQGPVATLRRITDRMLTCKGVSSGELTLSTRILPPVHGRRS